MTRQLSLAILSLSIPLCLSAQAVEPGVTVPSDSQSNATSPCPTGPFPGPRGGGTPPGPGAGPIPGTGHGPMPGMPKIIMSATIAPSDTNTSTVLSPSLSDQIVCGKTPLKTVHDVVFSEPVLPNGTKKKLVMDIQIPPGSGKKPLVVYVTGGGFVFAPKESALNLRTYVAEAGFVVASIQYRTVMDGANYRDGVADVKSAIRYLRAHADDYGIDPDKVAVWGESAGGYLASMAGVTGNVKTFDTGDNLGQSSAVQAVIDKFGPSDMSKVAADFDARSQEAYSSADNPIAHYVNGPSSTKGLVDDPTATTTANPVTYISASDPAFLLFHGSQDPLVSPSQTLLLHNALLQAGARSKRYVLTGASHGDVAFLGDVKSGRPWSTNEVMGIMVRFLKDNLG